MGANRYEAESKLRRIATKLLVTAIRNGYNSGPFSSQNNQVKVLNARTIRKAQDCYFTLIFSSPVQSTGRAIVVTLSSALVLPLSLAFPSRHF